MAIADPFYTHNMTDRQRAWFYAEYQHANRHEVLGVVLAIFLGCFGIHHFYLRRNGLGILYLLFFWTGIPAILGWIDAIFTPARVRRYNAAQASFIAAQILADTRYTSPPATCNTCGRTINPAGAFCSNCGAAASNHARLTAQATL